MREHVWVALTSVVGCATAERVLAARGSLTTGRELQAERALTTILGTLVWIVATGAWNRRAADRRPWRRR